MKKIFFSYSHTFLFLITITTLFPFSSLAQGNTPPKSWTTNNPFKTDVFIENFGQFNNWINTSDSIKFAINNSEKIFFLPNGIIYRLDVIEKVKEDEQESLTKGNKEEEEHHNKIHTYYVKMLWEGCNANAKTETSEESQGYYTFGEKGYENIKAKGYKKIIYKDLYPGIDVEYTIPDKGGIKYKLIVHPGADINKVKMGYSGDIEKIKKDNSGNLMIKTPAGNIIDHAPNSLYKESNTGILSAFEINKNIVSLKLNELQTPGSKLQTAIIDPWIIVPTSLVSDNTAFDIAFDDYGDVYVAGGVYPFMIAKYSNIGTLIWTFTEPIGWAYGLYYSKFGILPHSGTTFMGEGFDPSGPQVIKISPSGTLVVTSPNLGPNNEIWSMFYNRCTGQLIAFGGGTAYDYNLHIIADTNLTSGTSSDFNTYTCTDNDIVSAKMDNNGDFYSLMVDIVCPVNNHLMKSLLSSGYTPPTAFDVNTSYNFVECDNSGIPGLGGLTVRANAMALNTHYLFTYDGETLDAWDKTSGSLLGSIIIDPTYAAGVYRTHEGIAVDECNNIYVGGTNKVHEYSFDGSTFTPVTLYTTYITNEVYDISLDETSDNLYVCGLGFVSTFPVTTCLVNQLLISTSADSCFNSATVTVNSGTPPYTYIWSNGATTGTISGVSSGTYTVTVTDNSCIREKGIDTVVINSPYNMYISRDTTICFGSSVDLSVHGANSYTWSPAIGLSSVTDSVVTAIPNDTIIYTVTGTFPNGCTGSLPVTINVTNNPTSIHVSPDTTICYGDSALLHASGGSNFIWSPAGTLNNATISNPVASPASTTIYYVTVTNPPCLTGNTDSIKVIVKPIPVINVSNDTGICSGNSVSLFASGGTTYTWSPAYSLSNNLIANPIANPYTSTMYYVTVSNGACYSKDSVMISVFPNPVVTISSDSTICYGDSIRLFAGGGSSYEWSPSGSLNNYQISNPYAHPSVSTIYTVTVSIAPCSESGSVSVSVVSINDYAGNDTTICKGEPAFLHASGGANYFWIPSNGLNNQSISSPLAVPDSTTMYFVTISESGCKKVDSVSIIVYDCSLIIPNVFTPNGDGKNDYFNIYYGGFEKYHLLVFNRWGVCLFESNDKNVLWDGKTPDGRNASDGTYFYILDVGKNSYHGAVTLLR
ncbi:MAG: gliding motility-associated C-terminal domain-containing protein [Bacteroidales bacterium]|jgi:gliding motility-associated-like protein